MTPAFANWCTK